MAKVRFITSLIMIIIGVGILASTSAHAQDNDKPTPTPPPYVIMITPTPDTVPQSLFIEDLPKKIREPEPKIGGGPEDNPIPVEVDQTIDANFAWLLARQQEYRGMTGRYCQLLQSHLGIPKDGEHVYPDGWFVHPSDQQYTWADLNAIQFEPIPFAIRADVYNGPEGHGFVACYRIVIEGVIWERCKNYGPESWRNQPWYVVEVGE